MPFAARELGSFLLEPCAEKQKRWGNKEKKETLVTDHGFFGPSEIPKYDKPEG